jgi:hypothetical protein
MSTSDLSIDQLASVCGGASLDNAKKTARVLGAGAKYVTSKDFWQTPGVAREEWNYLSNNGRTTTDNHVNVIKSTPAGRNYSDSIDRIIGK